MLLLFVCLVIFGCMTDIVRFLFLRCWVFLLTFASVRLPSGKKSSYLNLVFCLLSLLLSTSLGSQVDGPWPLRWHFPRTMPDVLCVLWLAGHRLLPPTCQPRDVWALALQSSSQTPQSSVHKKIRFHKAPRVTPSIDFQNFLWMSFDTVAAAALSGSCLTGSNHLAFPGLSSSPQDLRLEHLILQLWTAPRALLGSSTVGSRPSSTSTVCFSLSIKTLYFVFV